MRDVYGVNNVGWRKERDKFMGRAGTATNGECH
jgi:hypothetical protein